MSRFEFTTELWLYEGDAAWHFITVPEDISDRIEADASKGGFGSVRVRVTVGATTWSTSLFPDSKRGAYVLPVKKEIRRSEALSPGGLVAVALEISDDVE